MKFLQSSLTESTDEFNSKKSEPLNNKTGSLLWVQIHPYSSLTTNVIGWLR